MATTSVAPPPVSVNLVVPSQSEELAPENTLLAIDLIADKFAVKKTESSLPQAHTMESLLRHQSQGVAKAEFFFLPYVANKAMALTRPEKVAADLACVTLYVTKAR
jgi:hypothetical protein